MLQVKELNQYYGGSHILRGVNFEARIGEVTCLLGRNGVGKTTLLKCLMGLIPARSGSVLWQEKNVTHWKPHQRVRAGVAYVPQGRDIFPRLTVEENLLLGLSRFSAQEARRVPDDIYALFPVLQEMKHRRGGDLSGGQQQQLAIGRALASRPQLLILDEPTEGIQPSVIKEIGQVISQLAHRGDMAILLVEQFYDFAQQLADKYLLMSRGSIIQSGDGKNMESEGVRGLVLDLHAILGGPGVHVGLEAGLLRAREGVHDRDGALRGGRTGRLLGLVRRSARGATGGGEDRRGGQNGQGTLEM